MKSVGLLILSSIDSTLINILRTMENSTKYKFNHLIYGTENEFIEQSFKTKLLKKPSSETEMIPFLIEACEKHNIDIILPATLEFARLLCGSLEQLRLANIEPLIPVSDPSLLDILTHRPTLFEYSKNVLSIPTPEYGIIDHKRMIQELTQTLGFPEKPILFSPSHYTHSGNIRLIDGSMDKRKLFFNEKPDAVYTTLPQFTASLEDEFPEITAICYDCTAEYSVEVLCRKGITFAILVYPSNPLSLKMNPYTVLTKDKHYPDIEKLVKRAVEGFGLSYSVGMRIWIDSEGNARLANIIPHLSDAVVLCHHGGVNFPELMMDMALQIFDYKYQPSVKWGLQMQQVWLELLDYQGDVWKTEM